MAFAHPFEPPPELLRAGPLEVLPHENLALAQGRPLMLTVREFRVLTELARRADRIVPREDLFRFAWDGEMRAGDRSVDVYVRKLRVKLARALPDWRFIHTHFGFGYRFAAEATGRSPVGNNNGAAHGQTRVP